MDNLPSWWTITLTKFMKFIRMVMSFLDCLLYHGLFLMQCNLCRTTKNISAQVFSLLSMYVD